MNNNIKLIMSDVMFIINMILDVFKLVIFSIIIAIPLVPPVTKFRFFKIILKFNAANSRAITRIEYFFISHLLNNIMSYFF